jgi:hypothetical protein
MHGEMLWLVGQRLLGVAEVTTAGLEGMSWLQRLFLYVRILMSTHCWNALLAEPHVLLSCVLPVCCRVDCRKCRA